MKTMEGMKLNAGNLNIFLLFMNFMLSMVQIVREIEIPYKFFSETLWLCEVNQDCVLHRILNPPGRQSNDFVVPLG